MIFLQVVAQLKLQVTDGSQSLRGATTPAAAPQAGSFNAELGFSMFFLGGDRSNQFMLKKKTK